jgi:hypothetical protein
MTGTDFYFFSPMIRTYVLKAAKIEELAGVFKQKPGSFQGVASRYALKWHYLVQEGLWDLHF